MKSCFVAPHSTAWPNAVQHSAATARERGEEQSGRGQRAVTQIIDDVLGALFTSTGASQLSYICIHIYYIFFILTHTVRHRFSFPSAIFLVDLYYHVPGYTL